MKIFDQQPPFTNKVNFVDEFGTLVGYDMSQRCCEDAGWFIADHVCKSAEDDVSEQYDLTKYRFDEHFFQETSGEYDKELDREFHAVVFCLKAVGRRDKPVLFLHLHNTHNGYYERGFHFLRHNVATKTGTI